MLDAMAHRYGVLPSKIIQGGDTLDVWVFDVAQSYSEYETSKSKSSQAGKDLQSLVNKGGETGTDPELLTAYQRFKHGGQS
jgi:predicted heme/steroid binding protein